MISSSKSLAWFGRKLDASVKQLARSTKTNWLICSLAIGICTAEIFALVFGFIAGYFVVAIGLMWLVSIDLGWGDEIPAAFPLGIAALAIFGPSHGAVIALAGSGLGMLLDRSKLSNKTWRPTSRECSWAIALGAAALALWAEGVQDLVKFSSSPVKSVIERLSLPAVLALLVFGVCSSTFSRRRPSWRMRANAYCALWSFSLAMAAGYRQAGFQLAFGLSFMPLVLWYAFNRLRAARVVQAEAVGALGLLPEITEFSSYGHAARSGVYADRLCESFGFAPETRERVVIAIQVLRLGFLTYPEAEDFDDVHEIPAHDEIAELTSKVLSETGFLKNVAPLTTQVIKGDKESLQSAIIQVVTDFDDFLGNEFDLCSIVIDRLRERHHSKFAVQVIDRLEQIAKSDPTFFSAAASAAAPVLESAQTASAAAESA